MTAPKDSHPGLSVEGATSWLYFEPVIQASPWSTNTIAAIYQYHKAGGYSSSCSRKGSSFDVLYAALYWIYSKLQAFHHYDSDRTDFLLDDLQTPCPKRPIFVDRQGPNPPNSASKLKRKHPSKICQPNFSRTIVKKKRVQAKKSPPQLSKSA